jgi:hypothetical protein
MFQSLLVNCLNNCAIATNYLKWNGMGQMPAERSNDRRISNQKLKAEGYQLIHPEVEI